MLEKIGLPPKPSMRGGSWVVDASHCQGCSSQFTFLNRKHHCRRCGGIFCNSCTQQRMVLRGQGDSPVRICSPCKTLEDAARFELRHGHKNRAAKGALKQVEKVEEEILHEVLGTEAKEELHAEMIADLLRSTSNASSSSLKEESNSTLETGAVRPEELRRQAVEEKKKYKILKGEGKSEEALQAFKRGKELERQAGALEIAIRKNRRMASKVLNSSNSVSSSSQKLEDSEEPGSKRKLSSLKGKEEKGDLAAELRELGWSDADLQNADKKPVKLSLEGELSNLLEEMPQRTSVSRKTGGIDKSEVISLKKKALLLKREGKLAEAKEELKKAKVLEKQIEEHELLGESDESDDELSALMRSIGDVKQDDLLLDHAPIPALNLDRFLVGDDDLDDKFEISDNDMNDPEIAAALKSFGWSDEDEEATDHIVDSSALEGEALQQKILSLKREALSQKREGNVSEAMSLLKKAKLLEKDVEIIAPKSSSDGSISQVSVEPSHDRVSHEENVVKLPAKSKIAIQRELLALKKKALALRREGQVEEADEELKKCKSLEQQLEEAENSQKRPATSKMGDKNLEINNIGAAQLGSLDCHEGAETEVTEQDMHDPAMMSVLKNLGWNDDGADSPEKVDDTYVKPRRSKPEIQRELLAIKRKALTLRRQGKTEEADEELERAKDLEKQLADIEASSSSKFNVAESQNVGPSISQDKSNLHNLNGGSLPVDKDQQDILEGSNKRKPLPTTFVESTRLFPSERQQNTVDFFSNSIGIMLQSTVERVEEADETEAQKKAIISHKRKALALKKEGKLAEAREELRQAKLLESSLEGGNLQSNTVTRNTPASTSDLLTSASEIRTYQQDQKLAQTSPPKPLSSRERFKMQQQSLAHKRNALKLRREGKIEESEAELELAKALESQLEDSGNQGSSASSQVTEDTGIEDLLDPQLRSALKSIGWGDGEMSVQPPKNLELKQTVDKGVNSHQEKTKLEETIKSEKMRALNLKREGKQTEALEALRSAKRLEKKLASLT